MTIAVAFNHSPRGAAALQLAAQEAQLRGDELCVLNIIAGNDTDPPNDPKVERQVAEQLEDFPGLRWSLHTATEAYDTAESLLALAERVNASTLVLGSRIRRPIGKLILGSVVQQVLYHAQIPVLVVKA